MPKQARKEANKGRSWRWRRGRSGLEEEIVYRKKDEEGEREAEQVGGCFWRGGHPCAGAALP